MSHIFLRGLESLGHCKSVVLTVTVRLSLFVQVCLCRVLRSESYPVSFDGVMMHSNLEHQILFLDVQRGAYRCLKPTGKVFVRVPNNASLKGRILGRRWCGFRYPVHDYYFSPVCSECRSRGPDLICDSSMGFPLQSMTASMRCCRSAIRIKLESHSTFWKCGYTVPRTIQTIESLCRCSDQRQTKVAGGAANGSREGEISGEPSHNGPNSGRLVSETIRAKHELLLQINAGPTTKGLARVAADGGSKVGRPRGGHTSRSLRVGRYCQSSVDSDLLSIGASVHPNNS